MATFIVERMGDAHGRGALIRREGFFTTSRWTKQMNDDVLSPDGELIHCGSTSIFDKWVNIKTGNSGYAGGGTATEIENFYAAQYALRGEDGKAEM